VCFHLGFHHCCLGPKNLDLLVLLIKNWPNDPTIGFEAKGRLLKNVDEFGEVDENILDLLDAKFPNEVEDLHLHISSLSITLTLIARLRLIQHVKFKKYTYIYT